jgi:hypothetical protein
MVSLKIRKTSLEHGKTVTNQTGKKIFIISRRIKIKYK